MMLLMHFERGRAERSVNIQSHDIRNMVAIYSLFVVCFYDTHKYCVMDFKSGQKNAYIMKENA